MQSSARRCVSSRQSCSSGACACLLSAPAPPVGLTQAHSATKEVVLPLSEPVRGRNGETIHEIVMPRGTFVRAHLQASNSNKALWGEDADEWKPERWLAPLPAVLEDARLPGVYSNL